MLSRAALALSLLCAAELHGATISPQALQRYKEMVRANPSEGTALDRLWAGYSDGGRAGELLGEFEKDNTFPGRLVYGLLLRRAGRNAEAIEAVQAAATMDEGSPLPHLALATFWREEAKPALEAAALEKSLTLLSREDPGKTVTLERLGRAWLAAGELEKAASAWEQTIALAPENLESRRRLAQTYRDNRLPERALPHLQYVAEHADVAERVQTLQEIAQVQQALRQPAEAMETLRKALGLAAPGSWLWNEIVGQTVRLYQREGRADELEALWRKQAGTSPRDAGAQGQLVELFRQTGNMEGQRAALEKITSLLPKNRERRLQLARLLVAMDRREEAAKVYDALLKEEPAQVEPTLERARLEVLAGAEEKAQRRLQALLAMPKVDITLRNRVVDFYREHRMWPEAEKLLHAEAESGGEEPVLALAHFLFSQHRDEEGEAALRRLVPSGESSSLKAAALIRVSQLLKGQSLLVRAGRALREAKGLASGDSKLLREIGLLMAENESALGDLNAARLSCLAAIEASRTPSELEEAEMRLFETARQTGESAGSTTTPGRVDRATTSIQDLPATREYLQKLTKVAEETNTVDAWLHLARWDGWCREYPIAKGHIERALQVDERSLAAHEAAIKLAIASSAFPEAREHLRVLGQLDPAHTGEYRRRLAQLDLQSGQVAGAVAELKSLSGEAAGNLDLLVELAQAQGRAEQWKEALATWQRVLLTAPAARKREATTAILRLHERLHQPQPAAQILLAAFESQRNPKEQLEAFKELLTFCTREGLLPWLHAQWEARRKGRVEDYASEIAWSQLLQAEGDAIGAFSALSAALYTAPEPADALPELVRQAEDLRRLDAAVNFQSRLVRLSAPTRPEALLKLADLQERHFSLVDAGKTWEALLSHFPHDSSVLQGAAEWHLRAGEKERAIKELRAVCAMEPADARSRFRLARLCTQAGALAEAEELLEQVLRLTPARRAGEAIRFPEIKSEDMNRLQATYLRAVRQRHSQPTAETMRALRGFWIDKSEATKTEDDLRLNAIRDLAALHRAEEDPARLQGWIDRWQSAGQEQISEALWGLFYAGAGEAALQHVSRLTELEPANPQYQQGFLWIALQGRQFSAFARWIEDPRRSATERDFTRIALSQYLEATPGYVEPGLLAALSGLTKPKNMWEAAQVLAANGCIREAVELGRKVAESKSAQPTRMFELAQWELAFGDATQAQKRFAALAVAPGDSLDALPFGALRAAVLLLPGEKRAPFAAAMEKEAARQGGLSGGLKTVLLQALMGKVAPAELRRLCAFRPLAAPAADEPAVAVSTKPHSGERFWEYLRDAGTRLQAWSLYAGAQGLWQEALRDGAQTKLQGEGAAEIAREVRAAMLGVQIALAPRDDVESLLAKCERGPNALEHTGAVAEVLDAMGAIPREIVVLDRLWHREPSNGQALRALLNACRLANDTATAEEALRTCVTQRLFALNDNVHRDLVTQFVDLLEQRGNIEEGVQIVRTALLTSPYETRLLHRLALLLQKAGKMQEAVETWHKLLSLDPGHTAGRLGLATLLTDTGRSAEALKILQGGPTSGVETKLGELLFAAGRPEQAMKLVEAAGGGERTAAALALGKAMLAKGEKVRARELLQDAVARSANPAEALTLQSALVESFEPAETELIQRGLLKLREIAGDDGARLGVYFTFLQMHAAALGIQERAQREMTEAWADGTGLLQAGMVLLSGALDSQTPEAGKLLEQLLARRDLGEVWLRMLADALKVANVPSDLARVEERLLSLSPGGGETLTACVEHWCAAGRPEQATTLLQQWIPRARLDPTVLLPVARGLNATGDWLMARELLRDVAPPNGVLRTYQPYMEHARACLRLGEIGPAKALLIRAFEHPGNKEYGMIATWLKAAGRTAEWEQELKQFRLSPEVNEAATKAVWEGIKNEGSLSQAD